MWARDTDSLWLLGMETGICCAMGMFARLSILSSSLRCNWQGKARPNIDNERKEDNAGTQGAKHKRPRATVHSDTTVVSQVCRTPTGSSSSNASMSALNLTQVVHSESLPYPWPSSTRQGNTLLKPGIFEKWRGIGVEGEGVGEWGQYMSCHVCQ